MRQEFMSYLIIFFSKIDLYLKLFQNKMLVNNEGDSKCKGPEAGAFLAGLARRHCLMEIGRRGIREIGEFCTGWQDGISTLFFAPRSM